MNEKSFQDLQKSKSGEKEICGLIDFNDASLVPGIIPKTWFLIVAGEKPYINMQVKLCPYIYVRQPDWWGIEVVGCLPEIGLPTTAPYSTSLNVNNLFGKFGIEVIGANKTQKIKKP